MGAYPAEHEEEVALKDGARFLLRPIRPEDEAIHLDLFRHLSERDVYCRFFTVVKEFTHENLARFTDIDYDREMAFIAIALDGPQLGHSFGVVRAVMNADNNTAEFAIVVRSDAHHRGLGHVLMDKIVRYCRGRGIAALTGDVLVENRPMFALAADFGFTPVGIPNRGITTLRLDLRATRSGTPAN